MEQFFEDQERLLNNIVIEKRYLYEQIDFSQRLIGVVGARGVGKTTLLLQYLSVQKKDFRSLYISVDNIFFLENNLLDFARKFYLENDGRLLIIDEVHKIQNWSQILKNIYDSFPKLKVIFSGSSSLELKIGNYDLSRRARLYHLHGFSFREYINFNYNQNFHVISYENILEEYYEQSVKISKEIPLLKYFKQYLEYGYYPYLKDKKRDSYHTVIETLDKTIYEDISSSYKLKSMNLGLLKKILNYLAINPPGTININKISKTLEIDNKTSSYYLEILEKVGLVTFLLKDVHGYNILKNTKKVYLSNTVLYNVINIFLNHAVNMGTIRELFFLIQFIDPINKVSFSNKGDFIIGQRVFEIGGRNKTFKQIKDIQNSYLVVDNIIIAGKNKIPLWLFGFMY